MLNVNILEATIESFVVNIKVHLTEFARRGSNEMVPFFDLYIIHTKTLFMKCIVAISLENGVHRSTRSPIAEG